MHTRSWISAIATYLLFVISVTALSPDCVAISKDDSDVPGRILATEGKTSAVGVFYMNVTEGAITSNAICAKVGAESCTALVGNVQASISVILASFGETTPPAQTTSAIAVSASTGRLHRRQVSESLFRSHFDKANIAYDKIWEDVRSPHRRFADASDVLHIDGVSSKDGIKTNITLQQISNTTGEILVVHSGHSIDIRARDDEAYGGAGIKVTYELYPENVLATISAEAAASLSGSMAADWGERSDNIESMAHYYGLFRQGLLPVAIVELIPNMQGFGLNWEDPNTGCGNLAEFACDKSPGVCKALATVRPGSLVYDSPDTTTTATSSDATTATSSDVITTATSSNATATSTSSTYATSVGVTPVLSAPLKVQDKNVCHGISGDYWVMSRDVAVDNVANFCSQTERTKTYNTGSVNQLELSVQKLDDDKKGPKDDPDCVGRFQNAVIDGCDGSDHINNPHNYKFGSTLTTADGWEYKLIPLSKQVNELSCDVSYKLLYDGFEIRGKNLPDALLGANGEGLHKELTGCGALTKWNFERTPTDCCFQWYAKGQLPVFTKACIGRAVISAGASGKGNCKRYMTGSSIDNWPGYGDDSRHVFKSNAEAKRDSVETWPRYGDENKHIFNSGKEDLHEVPTVGKRA